MLSSRLAILSLVLLMVAGAATAEIGARIEVQVEVVGDTSGAYASPIPTLATPGWIVFRDDTAPPSTILLPLRATVQLPPGQWTWSAVGPGWIAEGDGVKELRSGDPGPHRILITPIGGCPLVIPSDSAWGLVERIGILSPRLSSETLLPRELLTRLVIPPGAGAILIYDKAGRLIGMQEEARCSGGEAVVADPPRQLPPDEQAVVSRLDFTTGVPVDSRIETSLREVAGTVGGPLITPRRVVRMRRQVFAFFPRLSVQDFEFLLAGEQIRSERRLVAKASGAPQFLQVALRPRENLAVEIEAQFKSSWRSGTVEIWRCGDKPLDDFVIMRRWGSGICEREGERQLHAGGQRLEFRGLDSGAYLLAVKSQGETLISSEFGFRPTLGPDDDAFEEPPIWRIEEFVLDGRLLLDGKPVPGELNLFRGSRENQTRIIADEQGQFQWAYLGVPGDSEDQPNPTMKALLEEIPRAKRVGMRRSWRWTAFVDGAGWFPVANESLIIGGGAFDLELESGVPVRIAVVEAGSGRPLSEASVGVFGRKGTLFFYAGELSVVPDAGSFDIFFTDAAGGIDLVLPRQAALRLVGGMKGYESATRDVDTRAAGGGLSLTLELARSSEAKGALRLEVEGKSLAGGAILVLDPETRGEVVCSARADESGWVVDKAGCLEQTKGRALIVHPDAALAEVSLVGARERGMLEGRRPRAGALVIRFLDGSGEPAEAKRLTLVVDGVEISGKVEAAMRDVLSLPKLVTDERGEVTLPRCFDWEELAVVLEPVPGSREERRELGRLAQPIGGVVEVYVD